MLNDWTLTVATANGTGSQTANNILVKSLFRMGIPVSGKNLFPSNIQGLPTWFSIRVNPQGYIGRKNLANIFVAYNKATINEDVLKLTTPGILFVDDSIALPAEIPHEIQVFKIPAKTLSQSVSDSIRIQKLLANMIYVGTLVHCLEIDREILIDVVKDQFPGRDDLAALNQSAIDIAIEYAKENFNAEKCPFKTKSIPSGNKDKILIDGNSASAMGLVDGGCSFISWYPITPASSVSENFENFALKLRDNKTGNRFASVQAEDELSAINMTLGAGWAGARAMTCTSGPGLSLMAEAAGLSYFAEIPTVIWDVQRAGPSTGLPTRTMQGDLLSAAHLSHGDTEHIVLIPSNPEECFQFGQTCFDLAEQLQTLVIVLSDLDLGMNLWVTPKPKSHSQPMQRGKVLSAKDLQTIENYGRYRDTDGDGIPYRTLPGTHHAQAGYFTRGTGHNETAGYTEDPKVFENLLLRLKKKLKTARALVPQPEFQMNDVDVGLIYYGSSALVMNEVIAQLKTQNIKCSEMRIRALPMSDTVGEFLTRHKRVYVIEQNRDGQMLSLIRNRFPNLDLRHCHSALSFDGLPLAPDNVLRQIIKYEGKDV